MRTVFRFSLSLLVVALAVVPPAHAQIEGFVTVFDPSIQSAGMGGATAAVFWQDLPNTWINPSLASFQKGIRYAYGTTKLLPSLADDVNFKTHQVLIGGHGIGLEVTGKPISGLGKLRLNYGKSEITDVNGNVIGEIEAFEEARSLAVGLDLIALLTSFHEAKTGNPSVLRQRLSLAVGHTWKHLEGDFGFATGELDVRDVGALVRVAPLDQIGGTLYEVRSDTRCKLDLAGGYSEQNYDDDFSDDYFTTTDFTQWGASARLTIAVPSRSGSFVQDHGTPAIGVGLAWTRTDEGFSASEIDRLGAEVSLYDMLFLRGGLVDDPFDVNDGATFGGGVAMHAHRKFGARFDYARYPLSNLRKDQDRFQLSVFVDPIRLFQDQSFD